MIFKPKNVLVTGGMGFIGSHFIDLLVTQNNIEKVINLDKMTYAASRENVERFNGFSKHEFVKGDICDVELVSTIFKKYYIDTVVNFAAESHVDNSIESPDNFIATNIVGTSVLLEVAKKYWVKMAANKYRFHQISTDEVFGSINKNQEPVKEDANYNPSSPYSSSKASSDHLVMAYYKTYGLPITITLCSNNYGCYQHDEKFIPVVINSCVNRAPIPIYGDGSNIRDWIHVQDHCQAIWSVLERGNVGEKYNIPGGFEISNLGLAKLICGIMDEYIPLEISHESLLTYVTDRLGHDWRYSINGKKIQQECGWEPCVNFTTGLKETVKWYLMRNSSDTKACANA